MPKPNPFFSFIFLIIILFTLSSNAYAGGFAVSPSTIHFDRVLRGGYAEQEIYLYNPESLISDITLSVEGPFADWLYFDSGKKFSIPSKDRRYIKAYIEPPADIANGLYTGDINILSKPRQITPVEGHGMSIETAIALKLSIDITGEQIVRYEVQSITARSVEEGDSIPFSFTGINKGNVKTSPDVEIDIYNWDQSDLIRTDIFSLDATLPTTKKTYTLNVSSDDLSEAQYWANVSVLVNDKLISEELVTFDILKKGSLTRNGELVQIKTSNLWPTVGETVKIDAVFKNTGQISTEAIFKGEVYIGDVLIGTIESEKLDVPIASKVNLTAYYTPEREGRYEIKGSVYYSGKLTYAKGAIINVLPKETLAQSVGIINTKLILPSLFIILLMTYLWYNNRNSMTKEYELKSVSGKFSSIETNLEKLIKKSNRMKNKIQRMKQYNR